MNPLLEQLVSRACMVRWWGMAWAWRCGWHARECGEQFARPRGAGGARGGECAAHKADTSVVRRGRCSCPCAGDGINGAAARAVGFECGMIRACVRMRVHARIAPRARVPFVFPPRSRLHGMSWSVD